MDFFLSFFFACRYGYWAAGGQRGDLTLRDLNGDYQV